MTINTALKGPQEETIMRTDTETRLCLYLKQMRYTLANMQLITALALGPIK